MRLSDLLKPVTHLLSGEPGGNSLTSDPEIKTIHYRAQDVRPGGLFVAIPGFSADGHDFIDEALKRGASAIVSQKPLNKDAIVVTVKNTRKALAIISAMFYSNPSGKLCIIGITGTNGKTTTAFLIENILTKAGFKVGAIGTIDYRYSGKTFDNPMTTPESLDLQRILAEMVQEGISHVVMEVSSHAIDLDRINNCWFDIGVYTNLSQDHLDYHQDMDVYWSCKKNMFTQSLSSGPKKDRATAVINCNDVKGKELLKILSEAPCETSSVISTGYAEDNMVRSSDIRFDMTGITGKISTPSGTFDFTSPLVGKYNMENILCATGAGIALGLPLFHLKSGIEAFSSVPGRLESIPNNIGRFIFVDYAHTPAALENVLLTLRAVTSGRMICVFGCGGNRDKTKRPQMGEIAGSICDLVVITSDNPRTEDPMAIITQILQGAKKTILHEYKPKEIKKGFEGKGCLVESDRKRAIELGITASAPGDTVLIAGKGHETYQILDKETIPFDDRIEAQKALEAL